MRKSRTRLLAFLLSFLLLLGTFTAALAETKEDLSLSLFTGGYEGVWNEIIPQFQAAYPEYNLTTTLIRSTTNACAST
jgi:ABC-type glycerol-3-phosphate transport system substrate-binding protein